MRSGVTTIVVVTATLVCTGVAFFTTASSGQSTEPAERCTATDWATPPDLLENLLDALTFELVDVDETEQSQTADGGDAPSQTQAVNVDQQAAPVNASIIPADVTFFDDFEDSINANGDHGWTRIWALDCAWNPSNYEREIRQSTRFHFSTRYARSGSWSLRIECRQNDRVTDSDKLGGNERAEISRRYHHGDDGEGGHGDERWYGVSLLLPDDMPDIPAGGAAIVTQFLKENNQTAPYPNPTLDVRVKQNPGGAYFLEVYNRRKTGNGWAVDLIDLGEIEREKWTDLAFHVRWATDNTGLWEVWRDGRLAASGSQTPTLPSEQHTTFQKIGIYSWNIAATRAIHYDAYWMGDIAPPYASQNLFNRLFLDAMESAVATPIDVVSEAIR